MTRQITRKPAHGVLIPLTFLVGLPSCVSLWLLLKIARSLSARRRRATEAALSA